MIKTFEAFPVYKNALAIVKEVDILCCRINKPQYNFLKDQLRRAATSILLNLAEGAGKWRKRDKLNFYRISQASTNESIAAIDAFFVLQLINTETAETVKEKLKNIAIDLQALKMNIERRKE